jgi:hypothetical protein
MTDCFEPPVTEASEGLPDVECSWNVMAHGDARVGKWRGNRRMEWVTSTLHTTSGHGVSSITTAVAHTLAASSRLNWRPYRFKWTRPFRRKTKSGFSACAITFQTQSTNEKEKVASTSAGTVELYLSGLFGTTSHPDVQKPRIIGFFLCQ